MIPLVILAFITALCSALLALGYVYRTSFPMSYMWFLTGIILLLTFIMEDSIQLDNRVANVTGNGDNFTMTYDDNVYPLKVQDSNGDYTAEPNFTGIMLIMLALSFIMIGVLIERT